MLSTVFGNKHLLESINMKTLSILTLVFSLASGGHSHIPSDRDPTNPGLKQVLLLGDSVMAGIGKSEQGMKYLRNHHSINFQAVGCQRLEAVGCTKSSKKSALEILRTNAGLFTEFVVIATGYNEFNNAKVFSETVMDFCEESEKQGVQLVWLTYRASGNVTSKAHAFNKILVSSTGVCKTLNILDWNALSEGKKEWFAGDEVHLRGVGPLKMAQFISDFLETI